MRRRGVRRLAASARVVVGTAGRATFFASGYGAEDAARALRRARELCSQRGERSLDFRLAMVLVPAPLVPGGAPGVRRRASIRCGRGCPPGSEPLRTRPDPPVVETPSRPPQAGLEEAALLSPGALPPAGRLVWRSPVGSTGRDEPASRRSSVWLSSTSRNSCACTRSASPRRTARCVRWSSGCSGPSSPVGSSIAVSPARGVGRAA